MTDIENPDIIDLDYFIPFRRLGLEEIVLLQRNEEEEMKRRIADYGLKCKIIISKGLVLSNILEAARQESVSIIATKLKRETRTRLGSPVIRKLLRSSPVPVLIYKGDSEMPRPQEKNLFHHSLFATDWSPVSERAMNYLIHFKELIKMLEIVHVINRKLSVRDMRNLKKRLVETRKLFLEKGVDAEAHVYAGKPSEEINLAARDYQATSIVVGTSCKSNFKEIFSRSCAYKVAEDADVPVMVVGH